MTLTKYCSFDVAEVLDIKGSRVQRNDASLSRVASYDDYRTDDGYMYVRLRAISSRVNKNHDGWPTVELAGGADVLNKHKQSADGFTVEASEGNKKFGFATFMGKPNFIDHNNGSPKRTRGVVIDSKFRVITAKEAALDPYWSSKEVDARHLPASEIELLIEIDAKSFPKYAAAILNGDLDGFSMGADVERSVCSHCANVATSPEEYCSHIIMKGATHDMKTASGQRIAKRSYENCEGIHFFEISAVFEPADPTALKRDVIAGVMHEGEIDPTQPIDPELEARMRMQQVNGEGALTPEAPKRVDYMPGTDASGMPVKQVRNQFGELDKAPFDQQFLPPIRGEIAPAGAPAGFGGAAADALNEQWPQRPVMNDPRWSSTKTAEAELPQGMLTHAPESIDTLRDERLCPICGNTMEGETCDVCFPPGTLIRTANGYRAIETIQVGDYVLSHEGIFNRVLEVMERHFEGTLKKIDAPSLVEPILATPNHPFSVLVSDNQHDCKRGRCDRHSTFTDAHRLDWVHAECLTDKNYVNTNVLIDSIDLNYIDVPSKYTHKRKNGAMRKGPNRFDLTEDFLWAIGLYLAEGSSGDRNITFSSHRDETDYQQRIIKLFESFGYRTKLIHRDDKPNSAWVDVYSSTLSEWFSDWLGHGCANKSIPSELLNLPINKLQHLYQGYLDGDGSLRGNSAKTTSLALALQTSEIAQRLGHRASIQVEHPVGKRTSYTVNNVSSRKRAYQVNTTNITLDAPRNTWDWNDHTLYRLTSVTDVEYSGPVFNLRVENNPTYTVQNILVHNCGYVQPPKGFDNPDLSQAEKIRGEMKELEGQEAQPGAQPVDQNGGQGPAPQGGEPGQGASTPGQGPLSSQASTNSVIDAQVKNSMSWQPFVTEKTAARINKVETPIYPAATVTTNEPTSQVVTSDQSRPVTAAMLTAQRLMAIAQRNHTGESMSTRIADATSPGDTAPTTRVDVTGVGGVDEASNEAASKADAQVDLTGIGSTGVQNVDPDSTEKLQTAAEGSDDSGFNKDKTTEDSGPTKTFGDSDGTEKGVTDPVTSNPFPASEDGVKAAHIFNQYMAAKRELQRLGYDDKTLEQNEQQGDPVAQGGSAVKGNQPIAETFGERVNLLEHKTTPDNNSGPTKTWSGTDGNGVNKQVDPVDSHKQEWGGVPVPDVQLHTGKAHFLAAIKLAEAEIELGLTDREAKFNRIAELDAQSEEVVQARLAALAQVKTAGLAKAASLRTAGVKVPTGIGHRFERIASDHVAAEQQPLSDEILDSGLFSR